MRREKSSRPRPQRQRRPLFLIASSAFLLAAAFGAKPLYHALKARRAASLASEPAFLAEAGKYNEAAHRYRVALQLAPLGYAPFRGGARLAARVSRPEAVGLWQEVARLPRATRQDRQDYTAVLLQAGKLGLAERTLDRLLHEEPDITKLLLASRFSEQMGNGGRALQYARLAAKRVPTDEAAQARLAEIQTVWNSASPSRSVFSGGMTPVRPARNSLAFD